MHKHEDNESNEHEPILVDIEDLRSAFGGEAQEGAAEAASPSPYTLMCPQW